MLTYQIIETDEGLTVGEIAPGLTPDEAAQQRQAITIDPGPYENYEDAYDALMALKLDEEEEELD
jgi:hypothetical protein